LFNSAPYVGKNASVTVTSRGSRTLLSLSAFSDEREYINLIFGDDDGTGVRLFGSRTLAQNLSVEFDASYTDYARGERLSPALDLILATQDYDTELTLRASRDFGPQYVGSVEAGYFNRSGSNSYDGWWVGLRGRWFPDFGK
jgi:hypothetical protein